MPSAGERMKWTTDLPTVPGWYWFRHPEHKVWAVEVVSVGRSLRARFEWGWADIFACHRHSEWAGPIPEPVKE